VTADTAREPELSSFDRPVRIVFGARDPYLNSGMARRFHELLPTSDLFLLPARVARLLRSIPLGSAA
jgi:pimeloyl-ACP methyl ester carboxylesterase